MEMYQHLEEEASPQSSDTVVGSGMAPYPPPPAGYVIQENQSLEPVVAGQPRYIMVVPDQAPPDHLAMAILVTIFCCVPLGIVGIVKSTKSREARRKGDRENAAIYGKQASKFSVIGIACLWAFSVIMLIFQGVGYLMSYF